MGARFLNNQEISGTGTWLIVHDFHHIGEPKK
jgi:hypothetical protein